MRVMMKVRMPVEGGNAGVKSGELPKVIAEFMQRQKPEAAYFTVTDGCRSMIAVIDVKSSSEVPALCEPFFLAFNASIDLTPCMSYEELGQGLSALQ
jgi:hypothetical protein